MSPAPTPKDKPFVLDRYLRRSIEKDALAEHKMAFISGPRQAGKTTLGRRLLTSQNNQFSWDDQRFRRNWVKDPFGALALRAEGPVLLDEIHKDRRWKNRIKGIYDLHGDQIPIIVTGSARLDFFRRGGDSLMGRYIPYRLHPLSVGETPRPPTPDSILTKPSISFPFDDLCRLGTFPEPVLGGEERKAQRWSRLRMERLVYEDLRDFRHIHDLQAIRVLADLLPEKVGSLLSINSLREDVGVAYATVREWIVIFEVLYHVFRVRPYAGKLRRTLKAEPKLYLYDVLQISDPGKLRENLAALHLLKACHYWTDLAFGDLELHYFRTKEKEEIDFVVTNKRKPWLLIECKSGDTSPHPTLVKYAARFETSLNFQLVDKRGYDRRYPELKVRVMDIEKFFAGLV